MDRIEIKQQLTNQAIVYGGQMETLLKLSHHEIEMLETQQRQARAALLAMAETFLGFLEVDNPILKKTVCRECGNWTWSDKIKHKHNCIGKKAEQIIKDGKL